MLAYNLVRLDWALGSITNASQLASFVEPFRMYSQVQSFEDIGMEGTWWHDLLSNQVTQTVPDNVRNALRAATTRWGALAQERVGELYLITPATNLRAKNILSGIGGLLPEADVDILAPIEIGDLNEACWSVIIGSATSAEYMALRAAESLLRRWYEKKTGNQIQRQTWGNVLDRLIQEYPGKGKRPKEIALLEYLKERRDEIAHPERVSSQLEAETTLLSVCSLITALRDFLS